jgi:predicted NUDIX family NTP pyrophosphohydrolase
MSYSNYKQSVKENKREQISAGILVYRKNKKTNKIDVLLVHPGGPYWQNKDLGAWHIPKGGVNEREDYLITAVREFEEETGLNLTKNDIKKLKYLCRVRSKGGKVVHIYFLNKDFKKDKFGTSKEFIEIEWPPNSGVKKIYPENDKVEYVDLETAKKKIIPYQLPALLKLESLLTRQS